MRIALLFFCALMGFCSVKSQTDIAVMTFNVRYDEALFNAGAPKENDWVNRKEAQVALLESYAPDIIGMQEPHKHQVEYFAQKMPEYRWIGVGREDGNAAGEFNPIFYNAKKVDLVDSGTFWLSTTPEVPSKSWDAGYKRICTWAKFQFVGASGYFYVFNTHLDSKGELAREKSAQLINQKIKEKVHGEPVFVLGDFNCTPGSAPYAGITSGGLKDSKLVADSVAAGPEGTFNGFRLTQTPKNRIDFVFVNGGVQTISYAALTDSYDQKFPSDHLPVIIKAKIGGVKGLTSRRIL